ncbi:hypothetical protein CAPN004_15890 [Capnocytophaga cynodegmi]|uniref:DNA polymerase III subunit gamma/tau n=1 Tax=Capnocytophaga cynodegmi TaxID=28189 RepID=UPI001AC4D5B8|nr:DNA polymerase III subunit gamma/tau [Capnocytophaga cynodegmi]GIM52559.1 hypothetical protein CAPN004_15890 [Capnocytophaga cynodegmi]
MPTNEDRLNAQTATSRIQDNIPTITKQERNQVVSNFSIRSIQLKTEVKKNLKENIIDPNSLPREEFSEADFSRFWNAYIESLLAKGERIQASYFQMSVPELKDKVIHLDVSNSTAYTEISNNEARLLDFLRKSLRNYDISLKLIKNEELTKKILVTPDDKYEKLLEINPLLKEFREAFNLNLGF